MHKKPTSNNATEIRPATQTVTKTALREALARATPDLGGDEEKVLRMLHGVSAPRTIVLERVGQDHPDAREKLLGIELELLRQWRERQAARPQPRSSARPAAKATAAPAPAAPTPNPRREKIVQALRTKKAGR